MKLKHIEGLDGLRALAVVAVVARHSWAPAKGTMAGTAAVWLFFLLSGFLIFRILHADRLVVEQGGTTPARALWRFQLKRMLRIFPPYFVLLGLVWCVWQFKGRHEPGFPWYFSYLTNVYVGHVLHDWPFRFAPLWSLAVEEQFYLVAAPLMLWLPARAHLHALQALLAFGLLSLLLMTAAGVPGLTVYSSTLPAMAFFAFGGLIALAGPMRPWLPAGLATAVLLAGGVLCWHIDPHSDFRPWVFAGVELGGLLACALLLQSVVAGQGSRFVRLLSWRPLARLGRISYGVYLYHEFVPKLQPEAPWLLRLPGVQGSPALAQFVVFALTLAMAITVAALSWRWLESPLLRLKDRVDGRAPPIGTAAAA